MGWRGRRPSGETLRKNRKEIMQMKYRSPVSLDHIIECMKNVANRDDSVCIYAEEDLGKLSSSGVYFLDEYPDVVNDRSVYPDFVRKNGLVLVYYGQQFADVIDNVIDQRPNADIKDFVKALNFFMERDDFLDLEP